MSKTISTLAFAGSLLALMGVSSPARAHSHDYLFNSANRYVRLERNRVIIRGDAAQPAIIGKTGTLRIAQRSIGVSARDQQDLADYYQIAFAIREQAKSVANNALADAFGTVGDVLASLFSGGDRANRAQAEQESLQQAVHADMVPLCQKVAQLKRLQDRIAGEVSAFKPYTVVTRRDVTDCER